MSNNPLRFISGTNMLQLTCKWLSGNPTNLAAIFQLAPCKLLLRLCLHECEWNIVTQTKFYFSSVYFLRPVQFFAELVQANE